MIFGMPTLIELNELEETMKLCKELGFSFVELNMNMPQYQVEQLEDVDYFMKMKKQYNLFFTIHLDDNMNISDFNHLVADAYMETVERTIEAAKKLEIPILNIHMNHGVHFTLPERKIQLFEQYKDTYLEGMLRFRSMCETAIGNSGIHICIENTDGYRNYEQEAIELLLESKVFALTWDIGHSNAFDNIDEVFIMKHEGRLQHFHIHDGSNKSDHLTLGTGGIDLKQRLKIAEKHNCRCVIETKTVDALKKSVTWLQENNYLKG